MVIFNTFRNSTQTFFTSDVNDNCILGIFFYQFSSYHLFNIFLSKLSISNQIHPIIAERLGHSKVNVTLNTYLHVLPTMQKEAAEKINNLLYFCNL
jgi:integrase